MLNISVTMIGGEDPSGGISQLKNHLQETENGANGADNNGANGGNGKTDSELVEVKEGNDGPVPSVIINSGK